MEEVTGNQITPEKLKAAIELINAKRAALKRLSDLTCSVSFTNQRLRQVTNQPNRLHG